MFRYAADPFFFAQKDKRNAPETYAQVMKWFVIFGLLIFLGVMFYMDIIKYFIDKSYHEGLNVVPILLLANLFLGIFYNLSIWYKLNDKTIFGAYLAIFGAIITLVLNIVLIPIIGYMGSAWATFVCYLSMMLVSYFLGKKHFPVPYQIKKILAYFVLAVALYGSSMIFRNLEIGIKLFLNTGLIVLFITVVIVFEKVKLSLKR
jgi:O-antigen/teichoic acid export membrane protein